MSKKGDLSYQSKLIRRRIDRKIANKEAEQKQAGIEGTKRSMELQSEINNLRKMRESTYQRKSYKDEQGKTRYKQIQTREEVEEALTYVERRMPGKDLNRKNIITAREMKAPFNSATKNTGRWSQIEMRAFYKATRLAWQGKDPAKRNQNIMEYYGIYDLEFLVESVLSILNEYDIGGMSLEEAMANFDESSKNDTNDNERKGSPTNAGVILSVVDDIYPSDMVNKYEVEYTMA